MALTHSPRIVTDGLVLCLDAANVRSYPGTGTSWYDLSGNGNTGTLTNGPTFDSGNGGSIVFDGADDNIYLTPHSSKFDFGTGNFSIHAVVKSENTPTENYRCIFWHHYNPGFSLITNLNSGVARFWLGNTVLNGNTNILDDNWHDVQVIRGGSVVKIYVDGDQDATSSSYLGKSATVTTATAAIGRYVDVSTSYPFRGNIPITKIYNRALSAQEIQQNYNATRNRFGV